MSKITCQRCGASFTTYHATLNKTCQRCHNLGNPQPLTDTCSVHNFGGLTSGTCVNCGYTTERNDMPLSDPDKHTDVTSNVPSTPTSTDTKIEELRAAVLTEFKQVLKLAPADYTENCTNVVMSLVKTLLTSEKNKARIEELEKLIEYGHRNSLIIIGRLTQLKEE